jgi:hypothetical protein
VSDPPPTLGRHFEIGYAISLTHSKGTRDQLADGLQLARRISRLSFAIQSTLISFGRTAEQDRVLVQASNSSSSSEPPSSGHVLRGDSSQKIEKTVRRRLSMRRCRLLFLNGKLDLWSTSAADCLTKREPKG